MASKQLLDRTYKIMGLMNKLTREANSFGHQFVEKFHIVEDHTLYQNKEQQLLLSRLE